MTIRLVALAYDPEWRDAWPTGSPIASRVADQLAGAGYQVTAANVQHDNTISNIFSFVDLVRLDLTIQPTTGSTDPAIVVAVLRTILVSVTGYPPASIANVTAGQVAPAPTVSAVDSIFANLGAALNSLTAGANVVTWAIVAGVVIVIFTAAKNPGGVKKWIV